MTRAWSLPVWGGVWICGWALAWLHPGVVVLLLFSAFAFGAMPFALSREEVYEYKRMAFLRERQRLALVYWPATKRDRRHNTRARLLRRMEARRHKAMRCQTLASALAQDEWTKLPVLSAERDAAEREEQRLRDDVGRLEEVWAIEDREKTYRELTR